MNDYILSCCSTADLSKEYFEKIDVNYICFHYEINGVSYMDDLGESMPLDKFYDLIVNGAETKTSQVNADEFINYFRPFLEDGKDILHICTSSGLSGVINSANIAKNVLEEEYPDRKIYIVDSLGASSGYGLIMDTLASMKKSGKTIDELLDWVESNKLKMNHWFFSTDLTFYVKGGRLSKAAGAIGQVLNICPLLNMDILGKLTVRQKLRGKKKAISEAVNKMIELASDGINYSKKCFVCHSACLEDAKLIAKMIEERFPKLDGKVLINNIGTTIGSHSGPGTVSIFFWGAPRTS